MSPKPPDTHGTVSDRINLASCCKKQYRERQRSRLKLPKHVATSRMMKYARRGT